MILYVIFFLISIHCSSDNCNFMYQYVFFSFNNSPGLDFEGYAYKVFANGYVDWDGDLANQLSYGSLFFQVFLQRNN